jgi:hypothetical protein
MALPRVRLRGGVAAALQVSLPGYNVETTTLNNMAFDARFANKQVFFRTQVQMPEINAINAGYDQTIYFPEALAQPPLCFVQIHTLPGTFGGAVSAFGSTFFLIDSNNVATQGNMAIVFTDHMVVHVESYDYKNERSSYAYPTLFNILLLRP